MTRLFTFSVLSCILCSSVFAIPAASSDTYEERVKLLTGGKNGPPCDQNKDDLGDCLKKVLIDMIPYTKDGIPELNIPPLEPLKLNRTTFEFNIGATTGRLTMKNAAIYGVSSIVLKKIDLKEENGIIKFDMNSFAPLMNIVGSYKADVTINKRFHFKPRGNFNLTLFNVEIFVNGEGKLFEKDGHKFLRLHDIDAVPKIGDLNIDVTGIFDDPELSELASGLAKDYWREVYSIMLPETRSYWAPLILNMLNNALSLIPYDAFIKSK